MQSGEDPGLTREFIEDVIRRIKAETGLAVTLSLGERTDEELRAWKAAGADRYLLRFETSDPELYRKIHPSLPGTLSDRVAQLLRMRAMGYEIGSGVMVGIPGQTYDTLAGDIELFRDLDIDMIGIGPFLPSPRTPLGGRRPSKLRATERRAGAERRADDVEGGGADAPGLPGGEPAEHDRARDARPRDVAANSAWCAAPTS